MNIKYLREFITFAEYLNFSAASKELYVSQPTLSQHIALLEEEAGFPLVDRDKTKQRLTDAGELFVERMQEIINIYDKTLREGKKIYEKRVILRVQDFRNTIRFIDYYRTTCDSLSKDYPAREYLLEHVSLERSSLEDILDHGHIDFGFIFSAVDSTKEIERFTSKGYSGFKLYTEPCHLYLPPDSELLKQSFIHLEDLEGKTYIALNHPAYASLRRALHDTFCSLGVDLGKKLIKQESFFSKQLLLNPEILVIDCEKHFETMKHCSMKAQLVKSKIKGITLGVDVYVCYNHETITPAIAEWLQRLYKICSR